MTVRETPGVCGGYPCVGDTRIPVRCLVIAYRQLGTFDEVVACFPTLSRREVRAALDWYIVHPERVNEDIERNAQEIAT
jgi:uncharacterized protein (DUF433 family)